MATPNLMVNFSNHPQVFNARYTSSSSSLLFLGGGGGGGGGGGAATFCFC